MSFRQRMLDRFLPVRVDAAPTVRSDTATNPTAGAAAFSGASVMNMISGLGGTRDSGAQARPNCTRAYLSQIELVALMRGTVYRRIVETLPKWATKKGWTLTDDTDDEQPLHREMRRLSVAKKIREADNWARCLGESRILLVTDDPAELHEPLDPSKVTRLIRLEILDRREFTPVSYNGDAENGEFGMPELYHIHPIRQGVIALESHVHASRLLRFYGDDLPPSERGYGSNRDTVWGADAIGQVLWDGIRHLDQVGAGGAKIAQELTISVFKMESMKGKTAGDQAQDAISKMRTIQLMKSIVNGIFLSQNDSFERVAASPSGFGELSSHAQAELALLTGYPLALLYGEAPSGLSTDSSSWMDNWSATVSSHQDDRYRDNLETIIRILYAVNGGEPDGWKLEFNPLAELTEKEVAEIRLLHTQADDMAIAGGVITADECRTRYTQPGGYAFQLQPVDDEMEDPDDEIDEEALASAEAMVRARMLETSEPTENEDAEDDDSMWIGIRLPSTIEPQWKDAIREIENVAGSIRIPPDPPHVTVIYLGDVAETDVEEVVAIVEGVAHGFTPPQIEAKRVRIFSPGAHSKGMHPVVLGVEQWGELPRLHAKLLPRLAHLISAQQFPNYSPHLTLGYALNLPAESQARALELELDEIKWTAGSVEIRRGRMLVAVVPLSGSD